MSSISNKVKGLRDALNNQIENAPAFIAGDQIHTWEILKNRPGTCKIAVGFTSEAARVNGPGLDITGRINQYYFAVISRGRGMNLTRSDDLIYGSGGGSPLFELAEQMRNLMRGIRFSPQTDEVPDYISLEPWGQEFGMMIDALICKIWVGTQLELPSSTPDNTQPIL